MTTEMLVTLDGKAVTEGELSHVFIDPATQRKCDVPPDIRAGLERYVVAVEA